MGTFRENSSLCHDALQPLSLGCLSCRDLSLCGGLFIREPVFNCLSFCKCGGDTSDCQFVCRQNLEDYINRHIEVEGFSLSNVARSRPLLYPKLPRIIPVLYGGYKRRLPLRASAVAIPLKRLFDGSSGLLKFATREQLAESLHWDPAAALVISGVAEDDPIERYWDHRRAVALPRQLAALRPDLITAPNYSLFLNAPREHNMYNMKRIAICWDELVAEGLSASLHVNAQTDREWERWTEFVSERDEVRSIAYEFATGPAYLERGKWHVDKLIKLATDVGRDLQIVLRGGYYHIPRISEHFTDVVFLDTTSYMKTTKRKRLNWISGEKKNWRSTRMEKMELLDDLLQENVDTYRQMTLARWHYNADSSSSPEVGSGI